MKLFCILLLVANVLFFGWRVNERLYGGSTDLTGTPEVAPLPADVPRLTLLSEASDAPVAKDESVASDAEPASQPAAESSDASDGSMADASTESQPSPAATNEPPTEAPSTSSEPTAVAELTGPAANNAPADTAAKSENPPPPDSTSQKNDASTPTETSVAKNEEEAASSTASAPTSESASPTTVAANEPDKATSSESSTASNSTKCATIGPYPDQDAMTKAEEQISGKVFRSNGRSQSSREAKMFSVFLEPTGTEAEAEKRLDDLKSKGITDYFLVRRGEMRNAIQVGTFRSQESVTKRLAEMERSGYKAVVVPKSEGVQRFWLDVAYDGEKQSLKSLKEVAGKGIKVLESDCPP
ncbi:MAG: hypothetical protein U1F34_04435 [Gammaproteobacteria bacterium]